MTESCKQCRFSWEVPHTNLRVCRKKPPLYVKTNGGHRSQWPEVRPSDWCGAYEGDVTVRGYDHGT